VSLLQSLCAIFAVSGPRRQRNPRTVPRFRPTLEGLEDRTVPSATAALAVPQLAPALAAPPPHQISTILPIRITDIVVQNGQLVAQGVVGSTAFTAPITLTTSPNPGGDTPILHLRIDAIHLDLLGLKVDTSNICLDITAHSGTGNLLGNLLSDVAHLLDSGTPLSNVLGGLSSTQISTLSSGLTGVLNGAFSQLTAPSAVTGATGNILHLSLGPVDLNLLGLEVSLDNCANGPVTVDITAQPGPGKLLGNLLNGLTHLLDSSAASPALANKLFKIAHEIEKLL